jgi:hypothetical protein
MGTSGLWQHMSSGGLLGIVAGDLGGAIRLQPVTCISKVVTTTELRAVFHGQPHGLALGLRGVHLVGNVPQQAVRGAGIQPSAAAPKLYDAQRAFFQIHCVEVGDFQLAAARGFDGAGELGDESLAKIQPGGGPDRWGMEALFEDIDQVAAAIVELGCSLVPEPPASTRPFLFILPTPF